MTLPRVPVHYHAHGTGALRFACYDEDAEARRAAGVVVPSTVPGWPPRRHYTNPRRTTNLQRVTCPRCWGVIAELAAHRLRERP